MYLDYINLWSVEKTQALYRASVKFKLPHLCEKAVEYMMAKMSLDSIWPIFDAAMATEDQILSDECKKVSLHAHIVQSTSSLLRVYVADDGSCFTLCQSISFNPANLSLEFHKSNLSSCFFDLSCPAFWFAVLSNISVLLPEFYCCCIYTSF